MTESLRNRNCPHSFPGHNSTTCGYRFRSLAGNAQLECKLFIVFDQVANSIYHAQWNVEAKRSDAIFSWVMQTSAAEMEWLYVCVFCAKVLRLNGLYSCGFWLGAVEMRIFETANSFYYLNDLSGYVWCISTVRKCIQTQMHGMLNCISLEFPRVVRLNSCTLLHHSLFFAQRNADYAHSHMQDVWNDPKASWLALWCAFPYRCGSLRECTRRRTNASNSTKRQSSMLPTAAGNVNALVRCIAVRRTESQVCQAHIPRWEANILLYSHSCVLQLFCCAQLSANSMSCGVWWMNASVRQ